MKRKATTLMICIPFLTAHTSSKEYYDDLSLIDISKVKGLEIFCKNTITELKENGVNFNDRYFTLFINSSDNKHYRISLTLEEKTDKQYSFPAPKIKAIKEGYAIIDSVKFIIRATPEVTVTLEADSLVTQLPYPDNQTYSVMSWNYSLNNDTMRLVCYSNHLLLSNYTPEFSFVMD